MLSISVILRRKPMLLNVMNKLELANEGFLLFTSYFMFICTEWIDVSFRYDLGYIYLSMILLISSVNVLFVIQSMIQDLKKNRRKKLYMKELDKLNESKLKIRKSILNKVNALNYNLMTHN